MTPVPIRIAGSGDLESLIRLRLEFFRSQQELGLLDIPVDVMGYVHGSTPKLLATSRALVLLSTQAENIVGYSVATFRVTPGFREPSACSIDEVYSEPEYRGNGGARAMVARLVDLAQERRVDRIQIRVLSANPKARALWQRLGFVENVEILEFDRMAHPVVRNANEGSIA